VKLASLIDFYLFILFFFFTANRSQPEQHFLKRIVHPKF